MSGLRRAEKEARREERPNVRWTRFLTALNAHLLVNRHLGRDQMEIPLLIEGWLWMLFDCLHHLFNLPFAWSLSGDAVDQMMVNADGKQC